MRAKLSAKDAAGLERSLATKPNQIDIRLKLIEFYSMAKKSDKCFEHILWMFENAPSDPRSKWLGHAYGCSIEWSEERTERATQVWLANVKPKTADFRLLCNAATFFGYRDASHCERLYERAKRANSKSAEPARHLARLYRTSSRGLPRKQQNPLILKALNQVDESLMRREPARGERIWLLLEFTTTAIKFDHLDRAKKFAKKLLYSYGGGGQFGFALWDEYAVLYLAWIAFKENDPRALNLRLGQLRELFSGYKSHVASCSAAIWFAKEVVDAGDRELALRLLEIFIDGEDKEADRRELKRWVKAVKRQTELPTEYFKRELDWPF